MALVLDSNIHIKRQRHSARTYSGATPEFSFFLDCHSSFISNNLGHFIKIKFWLKVTTKSSEIWQKSVNFLSFFGDKSVTFLQFLNDIASSGCGLFLVICSAIDSNISQNIPYPSTPNSSRKDINLSSLLASVWCFIHLILIPPAGYSILFSCYMSYMSPFIFPLYFYFVCIVHCIQNRNFLLLKPPTQYL